MSRSKVAVVSGGGGGIGADVCRLFVRERDLSDLVIAQRHEPKAELLDQLRDSDVNVHYLPLDLTDIRGSVPKFGASVRERFNAVNYLVLTAGVCPRDHWSTLPYDAFLDKLEEVELTNFKGPMGVIHALAPALLAGQAGIVGVSSLAASIGGKATFVGYDSSKGGLEAALRHFSRHCFDPSDDSRRFHTVTIAPGPVATEMLKTMSAAQIADFKAATRTGQLTTPEEVANLIVMAAKTPALTGQTIHVNSGILCGK
ncbi:MAG: SDR family oxidoreductase [Bdellovibrionota bacterium]